MEHQRHAVGVGQALEHQIDALAQGPLGLGRQRLGRVVLGHRLRRDQFALRARAAAAARAERCAAGDAVQPCPQLHLRVDGRRLACQHQEHRLRDVVRVGAGPGDAHAGGMDERPVASHQLAERPVIARIAKGGEQLLVAHADAGFGVHRHDP